MKKFLMLGAAALLLSTVGASAGTKLIRLDNRADLFAVTQSGGLYAQVHYFGGEIVSHGVGMAATTKELGKGFMLTDVQGNGTEFVCYDFSKPLLLPHRGAGGKWDAYYSYDGKHVEWLGYGTYTIAGYMGK